MAIDSLKPNYKVMEWDQEIYETLPMDRKAFRRLKESRVSEDIYNQIRSVFLKHSVQNDLALCIVHRHFSLGSSEKLVEYQHVTAPWSVSESPDYIQQRISPKNWAFVNKRLFPYEFRFDDSNIAVAQPYSFSPNFLDDLLEVLTRHNLQDVYGLAALKDEDRDLTTPSLLEFTAGRTNIVVPFTPDMKKFKIVESSWLFPCTGSFIEPKDGSGGLTTRFCYLVCRNHDDDDSNSVPELE